jgi:hypothetical protein
LQFGENVLKLRVLNILNDEELSGLPEGTIEAAPLKPRKKKAGSSR